MPGGQNICMVKLPHYMPSRHRGEAYIQLYQNPTLALGEGGWSVPHPSYFAPRKETVFIVQEAGWAPGMVWMGLENIVLPGFKTLKPIVTTSVE
jgi:hypothetical protein